MGDTSGADWYDLIWAQACKDKLRKDYIATLITECLVWPGYQAINFWKVPVKHQLLVINAATVVDSTFLCWCVPSTGQR